MAARSEEARASLALAQRQEGREAQLNQSNFASRTALDQARTDRLTLQARLAALAAERDSLTADLEDSTLKAPFAGRVVERHIDVGSLVRYRGYPPLRSAPWLASSASGDVHHGGVCDAARKRPAHHG